LADRGRVHALGRAGRGRGRQAARVLVTVHELPCEQRYLHGYFSPDLLEPVLEIDPGDSVRISVPNHAWDIARDEHLEPRSPELDQGDALAVRIFVRGARPGQTLV